MLKFLKGLLIVVGVILVVATIVLMVWDVIQINNLVTLANSAQASTATPNSNPRWWVMLAGVGALIGGFALGFGLGIPNRTFKNRLKDASSADSIG